MFSTRYFSPRYWPNNYWPGVGALVIVLPVLDLIAQVRLKLDDKVAPEGFSDANILEALNDAQNEFCVQTLCLFDAQDSVSVLALDKWVTIPEGTVWLAAASIGDASLKLVTQYELEYGFFDLNLVEVSSRFSNWRSEAGNPVFLITNLGPQQVRLVPQPDSDVSLLLERYRIPDADMSLSVDVEVAPQFHPDLVIGALAHLYSIPNREIYDPGLAVLQQRKWEHRIELAQQSLQTDLRAATRVIELPEGTDFMPTNSNTNGTPPNVNTET